MNIIRSAACLAWLALFALIQTVIAQPAAISWADAVSKIAGERAKAETCVALMKKYGDDAQVPADHCVTPFGPTDEEDLTCESRGQIESDLMSNCRTEVLSRQTTRKKMRGQLGSGVTL